MAQDQLLKVVFQGDSRQLQGELKNISNQLQSFGRNATSVLRTLGGFVGIGFGASLVRDTVAAADAFKLLEARIKGITAETGDFAQVSEALRGISRDTGTELQTTVAVFQSLARSRNELKATNEQMLTLTGLVQKLGVLGGASTQALSDGLRQFSQAMSAGVVRAEEFNSIIENLPELANAIAKGIGVSVGELRKMVLAGKLLSGDVFQALLGQVKEIDERFAQMPVTLERGWNAATQSLTVAVSRLNEALGLTNLIGKSLQGWASYLDPTGQEKFNKLLAERARLLSQPQFGPGGRPNPAYTQAQQRLVEVEKELKQLQDARIEAQKKEGEAADQSVKLTVRQKLSAQDAEAAVKSLTTAYDKLVASIRAGQAGAAAGPKKELEKSTVLDINTLRDKAQTALEKGDTKAAENFIKQAQAVNDYLLETGKVTKGYYQTQADLLLNLAEAGRAILAKEKPEIALGIDTEASQQAAQQYLEISRAFWAQNPAYQPVLPVMQQGITSGNVGGTTEDGRVLISAAGITGRAAGGLIRGPGTAVSDSILARLSAGEFVVKAAAVKNYGLGFLERLNSMALPRFAAGGPVGTPVHLHLDGHSIGPMMAGPSVAKQLGRLLSTEVLKRGRR